MVAALGDVLEKVLIDFGKLLFHQGHTIRISNSVISNSVISLRSHY